VSYIDDFLVGGCRALGERERAKVRGCSFSFSVSFSNFGHDFLSGVCGCVDVVLIPLMYCYNVSGKCSGIGDGRVNYFICVCLMYVCAFVVLFVWGIGEDQTKCFYYCVYVLYCFWFVFVKGSCETSFA
jgi:hypothetical protein